MLCIGKDYNNRIYFINKFVSNIKQNIIIGMYLKMLSQYLWFILQRTKDNNVEKNLIYLLKKGEFIKKEIISMS